MMKDQTQGITLRDYLAGQALVSLSLHDHSKDRVDESPLLIKEVVRVAYRVADAMLVERDKGSE